MATLLTWGALAVTVIGMMLVVAGVVATGFFLPGVVLIGIGIVGFAAAAVAWAFLRPPSGGTAERAARARS